MTTITSAARRLIHRIGREPAPRLAWRRTASSGRPGSAAASGARCSASGGVWRTPALDTLQRPALSTARRIGLLTLRGYILFAIVIVALKLVQVAAGH
jgi:hypothetical protein